MAGMQRRRCPCRRSEKYRALSIRVNVPSVIVSLLGDELAESAMLAMDSGDCSAGPSGLLEVGAGDGW